MTEAELHIRLMECEDTIHAYVERRIPPGLRSVVSPEDILQETWVAAFKSASSFSPIEPNAIGRWVTTIADSRLKDQIRKFKRKKRGGNRIVRNMGKPSTSWWSGLSQLAARGRSPSSDQGAKEAVQEVQAAIGLLPSDCKEAVTLYHIDGKSRAEVAEAMQKTPAAIHGLLYRGMEALRKRMGSVGRYFSDEGRIDTIGGAQKKERS